MAIVFVTFSGLLSSCEKDDDKVNAPESLADTSWLWDVGERTTEERVEVGVAVELDFKSTTVDLNILVGGVKDNAFVVTGFSAGTFTYTYSKPNVTITFEEEKSKGSIDGNKLTFKDEDGDAVFIREED
ncbi:MAG: hypothetical protein LBE71_02985 [Dysgonamonadaceae bacterium]|nr:hypothetical protein [Dysgonamonadaceae bacterium]